MEAPFRPCVHCSTRDKNKTTTLHACATRCNFGDRDTRISQKATKLGHRVAFNANTATDNVLTNVYRITAIVSNLHVQICLRRYMTHTVLADH